MFKFKNKVSKWQLKTGCRIEKEHTFNKKYACKIAKDHLREHPRYYSWLTRMESKMKKSKYSKRLCVIEFT